MRIKKRVNLIFAGMEMRICYDIVLSPKTVFGIWGFQIFFGRSFDLPTNDGKHGTFLTMSFPKAKQQNRFWEIFGKFLGEIWGFENGKRKVGLSMRKKNFKGKVQKRTLPKCTTVCKTYDEISYAYANILQEDSTIQEIRCNVLLTGLMDGEYTSDFVCVKTDGDLMVRECISRNLLTKPMTVKSLDMSRNYWFRQGVVDWGIVIDA